MDLKGKRLLLLGGSRISCEIIKRARDMGVVTAVTDWYELEKSPAKQMADEAYFTSTSDIDAMVSLIREKHFDGVLTGFTDSVLPYYAEMCDKAGLPAYGTKQQFETFIDKDKYKKLLQEYDIPTIKTYVVNTDGADDALEKLEYPLIVKPTDGSGSKGITVCNDKDELRKAISFAEQSSKSKNILVEKYLDAPEATIFWLFIDGRYHLTMLGNRHVKHIQEGELPLPVGYTFPADIQNRFLAETAPKMQKMFSDVGIKNGMMFMQCKVVDGLCMVYDIGYRLTGSLEYIIQKKMCGYDTVDMLIRFALTGKMCDVDTEEKIDPFLGGKYAYNVSLLCKPGKIGRISGLEEIKKLPGVIDAIVAHPEGDVVTEAMKGRLAQITVRVLGAAEDIDSMKKEILEINRIVHITSDSGEELLLPGMEEPDFRGILTV